MSARILAAALLVSALAACHHGDSATTPSASSPMPTTPTTPIAIQLHAAPTKLSMADRAAFKVGFQATNQGATAIDPNLYNATLTVNAQHAYAWDLALQNGPREAAWSQLPPGKSVQIEWPLGEALFEQPGDYHLVLTLGAQTSTADVHVTP